MFGWILSSLLLVLLSGAEPRAIEMQVYERINTERAKVRLKALKWDEELSAIARAHSQDMATRNFFSHVNPDGLTPGGRIVSAGYSCNVAQRGYVRTSIAENIYGTKLYKPILYRPGPMFFHELKTADELGIAATRGWMESPGHRDNILRRGVTKTGIGVAIGADDRVLITQMFC